jgi:hypothetical protein
VQALHEIGYGHGDLSPDNLLVQQKSTGSVLTVLDLFDLAIPGNGGKRTLAFCPSDHENLGDHEVDRFAAATIAERLLGASKDERVGEACHQLALVSETGGTNLLDFAVEALLALMERLQEPPAPVFAISYPAVDMASACSADIGNRSRCHRHANRTLRISEWASGACRAKNAAASRRWSRVVHVCGVPGA